MACGRRGGEQRIGSPGPVLPVGWIEGRRQSHRGLGGARPGPPLPSRRGERERDCGTRSVRRTAQAFGSRPERGGGRNAPHQPTPGPGKTKGIASGEDQNIKGLRQRSQKKTEPGRWGGGGCSPETAGCSLEPAALGEMETAVEAALVEAALLEAALGQHVLGTTARGERYTTVQS